MSAKNSPSSSLVLFCRRPQPGRGKQRLVPTLGRDPTAEFAGHLLATAMEDAEDWPGPVIIAPAEAADCDWAATLAKREVSVIAQPAGNLGERLNGVDREARTRGHERLIYIGSDSPTLTARDLAAADHGLERADVVLAPALDGGVTIMGAGTQWPDLSRLRWSSEHLRDDLEQSCRADGLNVTMLEPGYDIDDEADLDRLIQDLEGDVRPSRTRLREWLQNHYDCPH